MQNYETEQEKFWAGEFGNDYIKRNEDGKILAAKTAFFAKIISCLPGGGVRSCIEFGSNIGLNLMALRRLMPELQLSAVEINEQAAAQCAKIPGTHVYNNSLFDFTSDEVFDLTFVSGVLIHINPDKLTEVYDLLHRHSRKYVLISEYYNPAPVEVNYRGFSGKLFKRDFAGEFLDRFPNVRLLDYGFQYHRDKNFPMDDVNWFLMEKTSL